mmetsp:Transcript_17080/g.46281  ORF Transcript_17080/g.46281 Transcript_17080/m.46281 type:complete len:215 (-) Transcript_17080:310-954(-)
MRDSTASPAKVSATVRDTDILAAASPMWAVSRGCSPDSTWLCRTWLSTAAISASACSAWLPRDALSRRRDRPRPTRPEFCWTSFWSTLGRAAARADAAVCARISFSVARAKAATALSTFTAERCGKPSDRRADARWLPSIRAVTPSLVEAVPAIRAVVASSASDEARPLHAASNSSTAACKTSSSSSSSMPSFSASSSSSPSSSPSPSSPTMRN